MNIKYNNENVYENDDGYKFDNNLEEYILNGVMIIGMAGTGKSEILKETQNKTERVHVTKSIISHYCDANHIDEEPS